MLQCLFSAKFKKIDYLVVNGEKSYLVQQQS